eukprot:ANDGO_08408.mRNA.1 phosphatidylinositol-specific phospholipase x domain protein
MRDDVNRRTTRTPWWCFHSCLHHLAVSSGLLAVLWHQSYFLPASRPCPNLANLENSNLDLPFASYLIPTSHNSYLLHCSQLWGTVSEHAYADLIERANCKCVEIDVVDDPQADSSFAVTHRHTLCSKVPLSRVLAQIRESYQRLCQAAQPPSSSASPSFPENGDDSPLILSIEVRTPRIGALCDVIRQQLGSLLFEWPYEIDRESPITPGSCRGRILIQNAVGVPLSISCIPCFNVAETHLRSVSEDIQDMYKTVHERPIDEGHRIVRVYPGWWRMWSSNMRWDMRFDYNMVGWNYQKRSLFPLFSQRAVQSSADAERSSWWDPRTATQLAGYVLKRHSIHLRGPLAWWTLPESLGPPPLMESVLREQLLFQREFRDSPSPSENAK